MSKNPKVFFYVQHLLGIGHVKRASLLAKALCRSGFEVCVVSGGEPVAGIDFGSSEYIQLEPVRAADLSFSGLVNAEGQPLNEAFKARRRNRLLQILEQCQPDILLLESYPFGRRQLRWELIPLLEATRNRAAPPLILTSIRDVLQRRKVEREQESIELIQRFFDVVLVHGDETFIPLEESFPKAEEIRSKLIYTGYICDRPEVQSAGRASQGDDGEGEVLVSAGGGAVGMALMQAALKAKPLCRLADHPWRFLLGPNLTAIENKQLKAQATQGCILEPVRTDFSALLRRCRLSISQGGYNTVMDLLGSGARSVLVPFEGEGETEQLLRCRHLAASYPIQVLEEKQLSPQRLAAAIDQALELDAVPELPIALDGADETARVLRRLLIQQRLSS
jgi:predicted glycosyltransferase